MPFQDGNSTNPEENEAGECIEIGDGIILTMGSPKRYFEPKHSTFRSKKRLQIRHDSC
jgi:hypothetical protein